VIVLAAFAMIPLCARFGIRVYQGIVSGSFTNLYFWDSTLVTALFLLQFAVIGGLAIRDRRRRSLIPTGRS
jgi:hypothetical protein